MRIHRFGRYGLGRANWFLALALAVCGPAGLSMGAAAAAGADVAREENFTDPGALLDGKIFYEARGSGKTGDGVVIKEIKDGILQAEPEAK